MTDSVPLAEPPAAAIPIRFKGELGPMFGIHLVNILLTVVTFGIYRFWAKTRMRRYLWAATAIGDEPLEYTGTGKELLVGILKAVFLVLLPISLAVEATAFVAKDSPVAADAVRGLGSLIFLFLIPVGFYSARRYRLSRTLWRGIRANQGGSAPDYGARAFGSYVLAALTLGLAWPALNLRLNAYKIRHTWIGNQRLSFAPGGAGRLYKTFLPVWALYFLLMVMGNILPTMVGAAEAGAGLTPMGARNAPNSEMEFFALIPLLLFIVSSPLLLAPFHWYWAAEYRLFAERSRLGEVRFKATVTGGRLLGLHLGNMLIGFFTLGLGMPIIYRRIARVVERSLTAEGQVDFAALSQENLERPRSGEGLADALDVGGF